MSINSFVCPICGNNDIHSIGYLNGKPYCRRCISFRGEEVERKPSYPKKAPIHLEYELSPEQKELSDKLVENYKKGINSLVFAVCGSGKTEIVLAVIQKALEDGKKVGFAIPRRDVVIEIATRLKYIFLENKITSVFGGNINHLDGDIVCLTTHQLYRYNDYFDLLIIDELDAFPFKGDFVLNQMFLRAKKGVFIKMSATVSNEELKEAKESDVDIITLGVRYHHKRIPVPKVIKPISKYFYLYKKLKKYEREHKQVFVFVPTIDLSRQLYSIFKHYIKQVNYVNSKREQRNKIISDFKEGKTQTLFTTSVLERGVTVKGLQVIVFKADDHVFDSATLIQISGRVGRKKNQTKGDVIFISNHETDSIRECIKTIQSSNTLLQSMFQEDKGE